MTKPLFSRCKIKTSNEREVFYYEGKQQHYKISINFGPKRFYVSEILHNRVKLADVLNMTDKDYIVRGCTALIDAERAVNYNADKK